MASRYNDRKIFRNDDPIYSEMLEDRKLRYFRQYDSPRFKALTPARLRKLTLIQEPWGESSRLSNLAAKHYGDPTYWWVIARFNNKPTDAHFKTGEIVRIPIPRELIIKYYKD